jgi:PilZ domain
VSTENAKDLPLSENSLPTAPEIIGVPGPKTGQKPLLPQKGRRFREENPKETPKAGARLLKPPRIWQLRCDKPARTREGAFGLDRGKLITERRAWTRLPLLVPFFVRSRIRNGKDFLEFASALNVSAGGALLAMRGALPPAALVSVEIPSAPLPRSVSVHKNSRKLRAKVVRVIHGEGYNLIGVRFLHPVLSSAPPRSSPRRKLASPM